MGRAFLRFFILSLALMIAIPIAITYWAYSIHQELLANPESLIYVAPGQGFSTITAQLNEQGLIRSPLFFKAAARMQSVDKSLKAGEYQIPANVSQADVLAIIARGETYKRYVTVAEGESVAQILEKLETTPYLEGTVSRIPAEGSLLPETYQYERGMTRDELVTAMQTALDTVLKNAWERRQPNLPFQMQQQALTLASIVEKETSVPAERGMVAAVFVNRLKKGMKLQADPTTIYCITQGKPLGRTLLKQDLEQDCPYNTYTRAGLPVGPIANPGKDSIEAVLNPPVSDALYFVADGSGGHVFAATLEEHTKNVAQWRKIRRQQSN